MAVVFEGFFDGFVISWTIRFGSESKRRASLFKRERAKPPRHRSLGHEISPGHENRHGTYLPETRCERQDAQRTFYKSYPTLTARKSWKLLSLWLEGGDRISQDDHELPT